MVSRDFFTFPIMSYLSTDLFSDVGNTSEYSNDPERLLNRVKHAFDTQIKRFLIVGAIVGVCHFLSILLLDFSRK